MSTYEWVHVEHITNTGVQLRLLNLLNGYDHIGMWAPYNFWAVETSPA